MTLHDIFKTSGVVYNSNGYYTKISDYTGDKAVELEQPVILFDISDGLGLVYSVRKPGNEPLDLTFYC